MTQDCTGNELPRAPKFTASIGFDYSIATPIGEMGVNGNLAHNSGFAWEPTDQFKEHSYDLLSAQASWGFAPQWKLRLWGRNLLDREYYSYQTASTLGDTGAPAEPRMYGFNIEWQLR